ncbi:MAG: M23 family metallopeptidase [Clostridia bacterium]|nr:M23 family metallopeptidase [Clostridia bacterium]
MNQELDYAEMLEIPVSTVNVVKKKSLNLFKRKGDKEQQPQDDLKDLVVDSVNERVGAYVYAEDLSDPPAPEKKAFGKIKDKGNAIIIGEIVAVCVIAVAIFITNLFMPTSLINTFIGSFSKADTTEPTYSELKLSPVVGENSDAEITVSSSGVLSFTAKGAVYPVCDGVVSSISETDGLYTVEIAHTSSFSSVITGLSSVYSAKGTKVAANIPFAYSDGENEVKVSMYDGETLLNCYTLADEVPVWNS